MTLEKILRDHENDYVCVDTPHWRKTALGGHFLEALDDVWLNDVPKSVEDSGCNADEYDVYIFMN